MSPLLALRKALMVRLSQDAGLVGLLGGKKIFALVPAATEPPYVSFGTARQSLFTGGSRMGHMHQITLDLWSKQSGDVEVLTLADTITQCLGSTDWPPEGLTILQCRVETLTLHQPLANGWRQASLDVVVLTERLG